MHARARVCMCVCVQNACLQYTNTQNMIVTAVPYTVSSGYKRRVGNRSISPLYPYIPYNRMYTV